MAVHPKELYGVSSLVNFLLESVSKDNVVCW